MSDQQNNIMDQNEFMKRMKAIASDLWGGVMPVATETPAAGSSVQPKPPVKEPEKPGTDIRNLWKTADESVDWTDALSHSTPADGDLDAYAEVLQKANPLGELTDFAENISMRALSASRLESTFRCKGEYMEKNRKLYLAAMGLRIARDLLACLPVEEVTVKAEFGGESVFSATYPRMQLLHRNFMFVDPVELSQECGATFA